MKAFLKRIRADYLLSSLLLIALGVVFVVFNKSVLNTMGRVFAVVLIIIGVIYFCSYFMKLITNGLSVVMGVVVLAVGIWFLINPKIIVSLIPILIGIVLLFHGVRGLVETLNAKKYGYKSWMIGFVLEVLSIVMGILCMVDAFGMMEKAIVVVGVILIYNGLSNIFITTCSAKYERVYNVEHPLDVEFVEDRTSDI